MPSVNDVVAALKTVTFPGLDRDIVSLGYLKDVREEDGTFHILVGLSTSQEGAGEKIEQDCRRALELAKIPHYLEMQVQYQRPSRQQPGPDAAEGPETADILETIPFKIAVASGKGGVGKSTVAVNLALSLARMGRKTGLLDSDIYGPSVPIMLGTENQQPEVKDHKMIPLEKHGVRSISIGYLIDRETPVIWRGPMVGRALEQLMQDVDWGDIDTLVFDLPPGTGDIQISLAQKIRLSGAIIVTTPQEVALIDAGKGVHMFEKVSVPILGLVENMSYFACPHCGERTDIFRSGGARREAERLGVPLLGEIPIDPRVALGGDEGIPIVARDEKAPAAVAFREIARKVAEGLGMTVS